MNVPHLKVPLTSDSVALMLDLLCEDDCFRADFQKSPSLAFEHYCLQEPSGDVMCVAPACLTSKEEFKNARSLLRQRLTGAAAFQVLFFFESGPTQLLMLQQNERNAA